MGLLTRREWIASLACSSFLTHSACIDGALVSELKGKNRGEDLWLGRFWTYGFDAYPFEGDPRTIQFERAFPLLEFAPTGRLIVAGDWEYLCGLSPSAGRVVWKRWIGQRLAEASFLGLSADGQWLAYRASSMFENDERGKSMQLRALYLVRKLKDETADTLIAEFPQDSSEMLGWSPDCARIVLSNSGRVRIVNLRTLTHDDVGSGKNPSWSPDGHFIAWQNSESGATIYAVQDKRTRTILGGRKVLYGLQWSPDSRYLMACLREQHLIGDTVLVVVRASSGEYETVLRLYGGWTNEHFGWVYLS